MEKAAVALRDPAAAEEWHALLLDGLMTTGRFAEAQTALTNALSRQPRSIRLRSAARDILRFND